MPASFGPSAALVQRFILLVLASFSVETRGYECCQDFTDRECVAQSCLGQANSFATKDFAQVALNDQTQNTRAMTMMTTSTAAKTVVSLLSVFNVVSAAAAASSSSPACVTSTLASDVPTQTEVAFQEYSYCGGTLDASAYIKNVNYDKIVTLYYTNADDQSTPLSVIQFGYSNGIDGTDYEIWNARTPDVYLDGITKLLNITFQATDIGQTYVQQLNEPVTPSGAKPTPSTIPKPYARPSGFGSDITKWIAAKKGFQAVISKNRMFNNIEVTDAAPGTIVAAQSYANPDYGYNWVRDSSLTMDVVATLFSSATNARMRTIYRTLFFRYAKARATEQNDPNLITGLGEPKFNLDNTAFTGPWGRPQNDGPATAAITLMEFSNAYLAQGGSKDTVMRQIYDSNTYPNAAPVLKDLMFVANNWSYPSFDLWEEEQSDHFYTRMVQHRALSMGAEFATKLGDSASASTLSSAAADVRATLGQFWDPIRQLILYEYGPVLRGKYSYKDAAVLLGIIHGYNDDGVYSFSNDQLLETALQLATSFIDLYPIASKKTDSSGRTLGIPIGRYPEDTYNGVETTGEGNPWYLCTASMAEVLYRASTEFSNAGKIKVTQTSLPFWKYFAPQAKVSSGHTYGRNTSQYKTMIKALQGWGDAFMRTIKQYTPANGHLSEEIDRTSGAAVGAIDLTWSYASVLTAAFARAEAMGDDAFITDLANMYVTTNSTG